MVRYHFAPILGLVFLIFPGATGLHLQSGGDKKETFWVPQKSIDAFAADFPDLAPDMYRLVEASKSSSLFRTKTSLLTGLSESILRKAFDLPTSAEKAMVYHLVNEVTTPMLMSMEEPARLTAHEVQELLEQRFLGSEIEEWLQTAPTTGATMPLGLVARGQEFQARFEQTSSTCHYSVVTEGVSSYLKNRNPTYGLHCGASPLDATAPNCKGVNITMGTTGELVCKDHGLDDLCAHHDLRAFDAVFVPNEISDFQVLGWHQPEDPGLHGVRTQPCEVDRQFWQGLKDLHQSGQTLDFYDGQPDTFQGVEATAVEASFCYLFLIPCLEPTPAPAYTSSGLKWSFKFGQYAPSDCGSRECYRHPREAVEVVRPDEVEIHPGVTLF